MKKLIEIIKKIENLLFFLENILNQEYNNLLNSNSHIDLLRIIEKKKNI